MTLFQVFQFAFVCCSIASFSLLVWDHIITFGAEVNRIWSQKFSGATVLYALLRYGLLVEKIAVMLLASWYMTPSGCNVAVRFQVFPMILRTIAFGLFSSLRVYALQEGDWRLASVVFILTLPSILVPSYTYFHQWAVAVDRYGCSLAYRASQTTHDAGVIRIAGIAGEILAESIVIIVTIRKTFKLRNNPNLAASKKPGLSRLLLRDGTIYFSALLVLSLADMLVLVFDHVPVPVVGYDYWVVPYFTPVFRTILICRFLLMLRTIYYDDSDEAETQLGTLRFGSRVVGPLGTTIEPEMDFDDDDEFFDDETEDSETGERVQREQRRVVYSKEPYSAGLALAQS